MDKHDRAFDKALRSLDAVSLTRECRRRIDNATEGTTILFRVGPGYPPVAGGMVHGEDRWHDNAALADEAAQELIAYQRGQRYKVIRFYKDAWPRRRTLKRGLTLYEAQRHCKDPETSSSTCRKAAGRARTRRLGAWFDGYDQD